MQQGSVKGPGAGRSLTTAVYLAFRGVAADPGVPSYFVTGRDGSTLGWRMSVHGQGGLQPFGWSPTSGLREGPSSPLR